MRRLLVTGIAQFHSLKYFAGLTLAHRCWITAEPVYLRYVLTHGWRFLFIAIEVCFDLHWKLDSLTVSNQICLYIYLVGSSVISSDSVLIMIQGSASSTALPSISSRNTFSRHAE